MNIGIVIVLVLAVIILVYIVGRQKGSNPYSVVNSLASNQLLGYNDWLLIHEETLLQQAFNESNNNSRLINS